MINMLNIRLFAELFSKIFLWYLSGVHGPFPMQENLLASEQLVNLLQRQVLGLRIEEVDEREETCVENCTHALVENFKPLSVSIYLQSRCMFST